MKIFTSKAWRQHVAAHREALEVARNNKPTDWEREELARYRKLVSDLWDKHGKPTPTGEPGDTGFGQWWICGTCRMTWPCQAARAVFAARGFDYEYAPLRIPIRGEKRVKDGIELDAGHLSMYVQGVEPDSCPNCSTAEEAS